MKSVLLLVAALAVPALKLVLVPAVVWVTAKLVALADAHTQLAISRGKQVKAARILDSLAHFVTGAAVQEAQAVKVALDAGKAIPELGTVALTTIKNYLGAQGLAELQDLLGIATGGLDAHLANIAKGAVQGQLAIASLGPVPQPVRNTVAAFPPSPAVG